MKDALERAKSLYKRNNNRLALEILESNVSRLNKLSHSEQIQALDLLAALNEKQGSLPKAQSYAVQTIKADSGDLRGYLRLGKILQLSADKWDQALRVYERALKKAKFSNSKQKDFIDRQVMLCKTRVNTERLSAKPTTGIDPLSILPLELLIEIFLTFNTRELVKVLSVSRSWRKFIESQPRLWSHIQISSTASKRAHQVVNHNTVAKYINLSRNRIQLDMQNVMVKNPDSLVKALVRGNVNERLQKLLFNNLLPVHGPATVQMLRSNNAQFNGLQELRITTDTPARDLAWCLSSLPSLEKLDLVTTQQLFPSSRHSLRNIDVVSSNLHTLSILGNSGTACIPEMTLEEILSQLPNLVNIELHRVTTRFWPALWHSFANTNLVKFGFTGEGDSQITMPLPRFLSPLMKSVTLNNVRVSTQQPARIVPSGDYFYGGAPWMQEDLEYLELKRTELEDISWCGLVTDWGCAEKLQVLVLHGLRQPDYMLDIEFSSLHTLQYTNMYTLTNQTLEWIIKNCPALRKINLDGTNITGPQIVRLLMGLPTIAAVRCANLMEISADTIQWLKTLPGRNIVFGTA